MNNNSFFSSITIKQILKFIIIGLLNSLITLAIIYFLFNIYKMDYRIANAVGYIIGFINSFIWNKLWTFKSNKNFLIEAFFF
jgi:putative flippase GtrA